MDRKPKVSAFFRIKSVEQFFLEFRISGTDTPCDCTCIHYLPCIGKYVFQGSYCTFSKRIFSVFQCRIILSSFSFAKHFNLSSTFCSVADSNFLGSILFCYHDQKCKNGFIYNLLYSSPLHLRFCQTGDDEQVDTLHICILFFSLASSSTYARSLHQISFLRKANTFIPSILRVVAVNFLSEVLDCENCLTFDTGRLLVFTKCAQAHKQHHPVCTTFALSDVHFLRKTQFPLCLAVAFWFRSKFAEIPAASSKVR